MDEDVAFDDVVSDFIGDFRKLPFPSHFVKSFIKIGKIKAIFGLGMTPI